MRNPGLVTNHTADAAIAAYRIVKFGAADGNIAQAAAAADLSIGVTDRIAAAVGGDRIDVVRSGIAEVQYGAAVTRGQKLTSDANGKAIPAAPAAGANAQVIGTAEVSGVLDDIGSVFIAPSVMQG